MGEYTISLVVPTYGVATYLPEFLASIDAQLAGLDRVEFVFVDDGSPDDSAQIIAEWIARRPRIAARVVRKPNGGLASARNAGLEVATGRWVSFPDPDDVLHPAYLDELTSFAASPVADSVQIIATRFIYLNDDQGTHSDTHPLKNRFAQGTRVVELAREPQMIHVAANTGLFRREVLEQRGLRFDGSVRPVWEDGHLTARYLSGFDSPRIAMMADAIYYYRRRTDGTSLMDGQWTDPGKFVAVTRHGWLDALRTVAAEHDGRVPPWIQNMILYDVMGYFKEERRSPSPTASTPSEVSEEFFAILHECFDYIELDVLDAFAINRVSYEIRQTLRLHFKGADPRPAQLVLDARDEARGLVRAHYFYAGDAPDERFGVDGSPVEPRFAKTRACSFYGRTLIRERFVWLPASGRLSATLDGVPTPVSVGAMPSQPRLAGLPERSPARPGRSGLRRKVRAGARALLRPTQRRRSYARAHDRATAELARSPYFRRRFAEAWLLVDRDTLAGDNAEHLYRWLRANRPEVNAWFVLDRDSSDWDRLSAEGFRLIAHRSRQHDIALLNARHVLSSQIDKYITAPLSASALATTPARGWHYTFLQHGVTKDDLSIWINDKPIDLMITATAAEQQAIAADDTPYVWGEREVVLTGLPRHDRLLDIARATPSPDLVLVVPTWRRALVLKPVAGGNERGLRQDFWQSSYAEHWGEVLGSEQLRQACERRGYRVMFVPHPNMQRYLDDHPLPDWVEVRRFGEIDLQGTLARAVLGITDYSSLAFELAYIERPVVYFQFDRDEFYSGAHAYRRGTWSYEDDGFGPVTQDAAGAIAAALAVVEHGGAPDRVYAARMRSAFAFRDGRCCERTAAAVSAITTPISSAAVRRATRASDA